jgi:hypothetical protein
MITKVKEISLILLFISIFVVPLILVNNTKGDKYDIGDKTFIKGKSYIIVDKLPFKKYILADEDTGLIVISIKEEKIK